MLAPVPATLRHKGHQEGTGKFHALYREPPKKGKGGAKHSGERNFYLYLY